MAVKQMPKFNAVNNKFLEIPQPGVGGLNLYDLEYEQEVNQSPYMQNMMYRNGTFSKRYGQELNSTYANEIYAMEIFNGKLMVHTGTQMYVDGTATTDVPTWPAVKGVFMKFYQALIYYCNGTIYEYIYDRTVAPAVWKWRQMSPYIPEVFVNCQPAKGGTYDRMDDYNLLTLEYKCVYDSPGTSTKDYYPYQVGDKDIIDWENSPVSGVKVNNEVVTAYTVDTTNKKVIITNGASQGENNVEITYKMKSENLKEDRDRLLGSKYYSSYGSNGNSRLFLAGGGDGKIFFSDSYDHTYFPENNWIIIGSTEDDVKGFGLQYNVLIVFKPKEVYSVYSYQVTASMVTTDNEKLIGSEAFGSQIVNSQIGCDAPYTIQLINNQLTWFNSREGICTLVSTNVADERNVRVISRNINNQSNKKQKGILDHTDALDTIQSADYDSKYFIVFPTTGTCYCWDYVISPFTYTASKVTDPKTLAWFLFTNFYVKQFAKNDKELLFISTQTVNSNRFILKVNSTFADVDLEDTTKKIGIDAFYMTPFLQFDAVEYLKTVKNIFIQCRGDTSTVTDIYYYTDESEVPEKETESIRIGGRIWQKFAWGEFQWFTVNWANAFRKKCNLKKIQMCAFYFENKTNEYMSVIDRDMSITHVSLEYQIVKTVR